MNFIEESRQYGLTYAETRQALEGASYRKRIRAWIRLFQSKGYNSRQYEIDVTTAAATAMLLAGEETEPRIRILRTAMERITAAAIINLPVPEETA